jgi:ribosomal protein L11 methyltransferase
VSRLAAEIASPGVEVREEGEIVRYRVYAPLEESPPSARLRDLWVELGGAPGSILRSFREPDRDWSSETRRSFRGRAVGPFWIGAPWLEPPAGSLPLRINPGRAFGTGLHPTTRIALRLLAGPPRRAPSAERTVRGRAGVGGARVPAGARRASHDPGLGRARVLDLGTGSGVLALAALALGARRVVALDVDRHALANAAENRTLNPAGGELHLVLGSLASLAPRSAFDLILANLEAAILSPLLPGLATVLAPAGRLLVSGITEAQRESFLGAARAQGLVCRRRLSEGGWWGGELGSAAGTTPASSGAGRRGP